MITLELGSQAEHNNVGVLHAIVAIVRKRGIQPCTIDAMLLIGNIKAHHLEALTTLESYF